MPVVVVEEGVAGQWRVTFYRVGKDSVRLASRVRCTRDDVRRILGQHVNEVTMVLLPVVQGRLDE